MSNGVITIGTKLSYKNQNAYVELPDLQEIPDIGADVDNIEITTLADSVRRYRKGLKDYGDLEFVFLYDNSTANSSYRVISGLETAGDPVEWKVSFPDGTEFAFTGYVSTKISSAGVGDVVNFTASIALSSDIDITNPQ